MIKLSSFLKPVNTQHKIIHKYTKGLSFILQDCPVHSI